MAIFAPVCRGCALDAARLVKFQSPCFLPDLISKLLAYSNNYTGNAFLVAFGTKTDGRWLKAMIRGLGKLKEK